MAWCSEIVRLWPIVTKYGIFYIVDLYTWLDLLKLLLLLVSILYLFNPQCFRKSPAEEENCGNFSSSFPTTAACTSVIENIGKSRSQKVGKSLVMCSIYSLIRHKLHKYLNSWSTLVYLRHSPFYLPKIHFHFWLHSNFLFDSLSLSLSLSLSFNICWKNIKKIITNWNILEDIFNYKLQYFKYLSCMVSLLLDIIGLVQYCWQKLIISSWFLFLLHGVQSKNH